MTDLSREGQAAHPAVVEDELLRTEALRLRIQGLSYRRIAEKIGWGTNKAHDLVLTGLDAARSVNKELADQARMLELLRLDAMWARLWGTDDEAQLEPRAVEALLHISLRRSRLLGLDAPVRREYSGPNGAPIPVAVFNQRWDLSKLSTEQLDQFEQLLMLAAAAPVAVQEPEPENPEDEKIPLALPAFPAGTGVHPSPNGTHSTNGNGCGPLGSDGHSNGRG